MFPYLFDYFESINFSNWNLMLIVALLAALVLFRMLSGKLDIDFGTFNFFLLAGLIAIFAGLGSALLFQSVYDFIKTGKFVLKGMTVMGGLVGAAAVFIGIVLIFGKAHRKHLWKMVNVIAPSIVIAQGFGRVGCFLTGCCFGKETDGPLGVIFFRGHHPTTGERIYQDHPRLPTQLFEAIFMAILLVVLLVLIFRFKKLKLSMIIYLFSYSVFRFCIEFLRDDNRGAFFLGMSPSQIQSILFFLGAVVLTLLTYVWKLPALQFDQTPQSAPREEPHPGTAAPPREHSDTPE